MIDEDYGQKANDPGTIVGRKIRVTGGEVAAAVVLVEALGGNLYAGVIKAPLNLATGKRIGSL